VDPVPDPLILRKSGNAGNLTGTSGTVARSSDGLTFSHTDYVLQANNYQLLKKKLTLATSTINFSQIITSDSKAHVNIYAITIQLNLGITGLVDFADSPEF
jgi:hypothetical protein